MPFFTDPSYQYVAIFFLLTVVLIVSKRLGSGLSQQSREQSVPPIVTAEFKRFQRNYVLVYLIMNGADWLQGAYVYALYTAYGFTIANIGMLFIAGFGTSLVVGAFVGSLADRYGRKKMCMAFGILYSLSCLTKHSPDFTILMVGRVLGGTATSILFSSFESWMVHEHHEAAFREEWLGTTFAICTTGNAMVAVLAGVVASGAKSIGGPVGPFDASLILLLLGTAVIGATWKENTGDARVDVSRGIANAWSRLREDRKIALLGLTQSFFEGAMYIFVFMWTPALEATSDTEIPHGWIFASFMLCVWMGSNLFQVFMDMGYRVERSTLDVFVVACASLAVPAFITNHYIRLISFFVFEVCCGLFWPSLGFLRSRYVPEEVRATVMNFFRIPLNIIVCLVLFNIDDLGEFSIFMCCCVCLLAAVLAQLQLVSITAGSPEEVKKEVIDLEQIGNNEIQPTSL